MRVQSAVCCLCCAQPAHVLLRVRVGRVMSAARLTCTRAGPSACGTWRNPRSLSSRAARCVADVAADVDAIPDVAAEWRHDAGCCWARVWVDALPTDPFRRARLGRALGMHVARTY